MMASAADPVDGGASAGRHWPRWLLAMALVLLVAAFYFLGWYRYFSWNYLRNNFAYWHSQTEEHLWAALLIFGLVYIAVTALSLPVAAPLSIMGGALFGLMVLPLVATAASVGATLAFLSSRYLFRDAVQRRHGGRLRTINSGLERDGAYYLFTLRLVPVIPFWLINLGMGLTPMRAWTFFWVSLVGMLPGAFAYLYAGHAAGQTITEVESPGGLLNWRLLLAFAILGFLPLGLRKLVTLTRAEKPQ
jgi:uncharacterized membrane protein YdjX (TVP38/TMEM64 family)